MENQTTEGRRNFGKKSEKEKEEKEKEGQQRRRLVYYLTTYSTQCTLYIYDAKYVTNTGTEFYGP